MSEIKTNKDILKKWKQKFQTESSHSPYPHGLWGSTSTENLYGLIDLARAAGAAEQKEKDINCLRQFTDSATKLWAVEWVDISIQAIRSTGAQAEGGEGEK
jgi:hypothetical protein